MNVQLPYLMNISDLFCNFNLDKLKGKGNIKRKYKCADKTALMKRIFLHYMKLLIEDMILGHKVFIFPTKKHMELVFKEIRPEALKKYLQGGSYPGLDILMSNRKCYELYITYHRRGIHFGQPLKLSENFRTKIIDKINTGFKYC